MARQGLATALALLSSRREQASRHSGGKRASMMATYGTATEVRDTRAEDDAAWEREQAQRLRRTGTAYYRVETGSDSEALRDPRHRRRSSAGSLHG